jgi:uncharacterized protein (DUF2164 family)
MKTTDWEKNNKTIKRWLKDNGGWGRVCKWFLKMSLNRNILKISLIDFEYGTVIIRYLEFCLHKLGIHYYRKRGVEDAIFYSFYLEDLTENDVKRILEILEKVCEYSDADYYYVRR